MWRLLLVLAVAGCDHPSCEDALHKAAVAADLHDVDGMIGVCEYGGWSGDVRTCVATATTRFEFQQCLPASFELERLYKKQSDDLAARTAKAEAATREATRAADELKAKLEALQRQLDERNKNIMRNIDDVWNATTDADRARAKDTLDAAVAAENPLKSEIADAEAAAERAAKAVHASKTCLDNPLAPGC